MRGWMRREREREERIDEELCYLLGGIGALAEAWRIAAALQGSGR